MDEPNSEKLSEREAFEHAYFNFLQTLEVLASDPKTQCEKGGNYNVAWELKNDISAGAYIFRLPERLSEEQKKAILELVAALDAIPSEVLRSATNAADNLRAMNHHCWDPLRERARKLMSMLEPATRKNVEFFGPS